MKTFILTITAILLGLGLPNAIPEAIVLAALWFLVSVPTLKPLPKRKPRSYTGRALS